MKIVLLHTAEAAEAPADPVLPQLADALAAGGHEVCPLAVDRRVAPLVAGLRDAQADLVFNIAESFNGKSALESSVAGLLNLLDLRYTGSSPAGLLLAGDKALAKQVLTFHGIATPQFATVFRGSVEWAGDIGFPLIVKPPQEDASLGVGASSVVHEVKELLERIDAIGSEFHQPALVEQFIEGREFYVGVLGNEHPVALPPIELDFSSFPADRPRIASWEAKWGDDGTGTGAEYAGTRSVFPADLDPALAQRMQRVAIEAFDALRLRDYARIDLRVTDAGKVYVIEANPNCYLEREGEFARAAERNGLSYDALIGRIVELARGRYAR
jgi:D-alanine-D-alanine ligase